MAHNNSYMAELLQDEVDAADLMAALATAGEQRRNLLDVLGGLGYDPEQLFAVVAARSGMPAADLSAAWPPADAADLMAAEIARRYQVVPLARTGGRLQIAVGDPLDLETLDTLRYVLKDPVDVKAAPPRRIEAALARLYPADDSGSESILMAAPQSAATDLPVETLSAGEASDRDEPVIRLVNLLILEGFRQRASDIHLEPLSTTFRIRYRIDGALREVEGPPRRLHPSVISRLKIMAGMKISEKRLPQDGRIEIRVMERDLDLRVSCIPTNHGESIVMRILNKATLDLGLANLGFYADDQAAFERLIRCPDGIVLITGPTGSGKTTTLYACLNALNRPDRKIITVEDPVEYQLTGINQVRVRSDIGLTFATALRSILRQAPNIIMIGEIRDRETADIAVHAALTGHLVLSTLHTNDAPSAITRLTDIGVKPFLISSSVRGIMAQRLVRTICPECRETHPPDAAAIELTGSRAPLQRGAGCEACGRTGYRGRKGLFEVLQVDDTVRQMIHRGVSTAELREQVRAAGMRTLREDGMRKALDGMTTVDEVLHTTMRDED